MEQISQFPRISRLPPYVFNEVNELKMAARRRGDDVIDFGMGNPDQPPPMPIIDKLAEVARRNTTHRYSQSKGIPRLRKAITDWYSRRYGISLDPESETIVTIGSKEGLAHLALATVEPGDTVLVPNPSYPIHPWGFVIAGADIHHVPLVPGVDFFDELVKAIKIGFMSGNPILVSALAKIKSYLDYGMFTPLQVASITALDGPDEWPQAIRDTYQSRRDVLCNGLIAAGWDLAIPKATMFVWAKIPEPYRHLGSLEFSKLVLKHSNVAVSPGVGFGHYGDDHVRFSLIENEHRSRQAVRSIKQFLGIDPDLVLKEKEE